MNLPAKLDRVKSDAVSASLYQRRKPRKHRAEMALVAQAFQLLPHDLHTALDAPCGVGRLSLWLGQQGLEVTAIDLGDAAIQCCNELLAKTGIRFRAEKQNIFAMNFSERNFDLTLCFRFLHHFDDPADRTILIKELCRVTNRYLIVSYFSSYSVTMLRRKLRKFFTGQALKQYPIDLSQLTQMFADQGFELKGKIRRSGLLHSLQVAVFLRSDA